MKKVLLMLALLVVPHLSLAASFSMKDFLVQDVCVGLRGKVLKLSPTDSRCKSTRELKQGEKLFYHKHDQKGNNTDPAAALGYQRSDSFMTANGIAVQIFDFGVGGSKFGVKDTNDGFNAYESAGTYSAIIATQDATGGIQYFMSPTCTAFTDFSQINDSWVIGPNTFSTSELGSIVTPLMIEKSYKVCPSLRYDESLTMWHMPGILSYTSGHALATVLSYHYSHKTVAESDHLEKFFFTDQFGMTRWERWERPNTPYHTDEEARANAKAATATCNGASVAEDVIGKWYRVDCREWTNIIPVTNTGDAPQDWARQSLTLAQLQSPADASLTALAIESNRNVLLVEVSQALESVSKKLTELAASWR